MKSKESPSEENDQDQGNGDKNDLSKMIAKTKKQNEVLKKMIEKINTQQENNKTNQLN